MVVSVAGNTDKARVTAARSDLSAIAQALISLPDNFNHPSTGSGPGVGVCTGRRAQFPPGRLPEKLRYYIDPWGILTSIFHRAATRVWICCLMGADGAEGGGGAAEDIVFSMKSIVRRSGRIHADRGHDRLSSSA